MDPTDRLNEKMGMTHTPMPPRHSPDEVVKWFRELNLGGIPTYPDSKVPDWFALMYEQVYFRAWRDAMVEMGGSSRRKLDLTHR